MLNYDLNLTLSHLGIGNLSEVGLLNIFAEAQLADITQGTGTNLWTLKTADGRALYPAWYAFELQVSPDYLLSSFKLSDKIRVTSNVQSYGGMLLDSRFTISHGDTVKQQSSNLPTLTGGNLFIVKGGVGEPEIGIPEQGSLAVMPLLSNEPPDLNLFRQARRLGISPNANDYIWSGRLSTYLGSGLRIAPGTNLMFSNYIDILDSAEFRFISQQLHPAIPLPIAANVETIYRRVFYFGNCTLGDRLSIWICVSIKRIDPNFHGTRKDIVSVGLMESTAEIYDHKSKEMLVCAKTTKLLAVPSTRPSLIRDMERVISLISKKDHSAGLN